MKRMRMRIMITVKSGPFKFPNADTQRMASSDSVLQSTGTRSSSSNDSSAPTSCETCGILSVLNLSHVFHLRLKKLSHLRFGRSFFFAQVVCTFGRINDSFSLHFHANGSRAYYRNFISGGYATSLTYATHYRPEILPKLIVPHFLAASSLLLTRSVIRLFWPSAPDAQP